jgi:hypothetical protein
LAFPLRLLELSAAKKFLEKSMAGDSKQLPPLEDGLLRALRAIDNQILREIQRDAKGREAHGVGKDDAIERRVELLSTWLLDCFGEDAAKLESLLVLSRAFTKSVSLIAQDLGRDGLGAVRARYCLQTFEDLERDVRLGEEGLGEGSRELN